MAKKTKKIAKKSTTKKVKKVKDVKKKVAKKRSAPVKKTAKKTTTKSPVKKKTVVVKKKTTTTKAPAKMVTRKVVSKPRKVKQVEEQIDERAAAEARAEALRRIKGYGKRDLEHFKQIILEKRDEILEQLQNLKEQMLDPSTGEYINENSPYSLHMAEQGTDAMEREKTFLYAQRENKFLGYLEDALKRIENGTYGICVECIEQPQHLCDTCPLIPKARLEAVPHSQLCLPMKQKQEKK